MKLRQIVIDKTTLNLTKERVGVSYGEVFEVSEERGKEILKATFKGHPVAELVNEDPKHTSFFYLNYYLDLNRDKTSLFG